MKEESNSLSEKEQTILFLANMGYPVEEVSIAMERCGAYIKLYSVPTLIIYPSLISD